MKALFLVYDFPPIEASGTLRNRAFAELLPRFGIAPVIICADPVRVTQKYCGAHSILDQWQDDPTWPIVTRIDWNDESRKGGLLGAFAQRIPIVSSLIAGNHREARVAKIFDTGCEAIEREQPQVIFCSVWPPSTAIAGKRLAKRFNLPFVVDIRDPWSYGPRVPYRHIVDFYIERSIERSVLAAASSVITPTFASRQLLVDHLGVPMDRTRVIPNGFNELRKDSDSPLEPGVFTLLHAGDIGVDRREKRAIVGRIKSLLGIDYDPMARDFSTRSVNIVLGAIDDLLLRRPDLRSKIRLRLLGAEGTKTRAAIDEAACGDRVIADNRVSQEFADQMIQRADMLLLLQVSYWLGGRPFCPAVPAKLYSYLASGRPIIASAQESEITHMIRSTASGVVVPPGSVAHLARAIEAAVDDWQYGREKCYVWSEKMHYSRPFLTERLAECLRAAAFP